MAEVPGELHYNADHDWVLVEDGVGTCGITDYAQGELGDIVYVEIETVGETLQNEEVFGTVEAVKTVSDLFMPVSGKVLEKNEDIEATPDSVNHDPYGAGWMVKVEVSNTSEIDNLLSADEYKNHIGA